MIASACNMSCGGADLVVPLKKELRSVAPSPSMRIETHDGAADSDRRIHIPFIDGVVSPG
jgi:hypothetical protein